MSIFESRPAGKLRYPDIPAASWDEYVLGTDACGTWAVLPAGEPCRFANGDVGRLDGDQVRCYSPDGWTAQWWFGTRTQHVVRADGTRRSRVIDILEYVDMCTPGAGGPGFFVDLVLDVMRTADGTVRILDEDEVEEESRRYGIPAELIEGARAGVKRVYEDVVARRGAFDGRAEAWAARFRAG